MGGLGWVGLGRLSLVGWVRWAGLGGVGWVELGGLSWVGWFGWAGLGGLVGLV